MVSKFAFSRSQKLKIFSPRRGGASGRRGHAPQGRRGQDFSVSLCFCSALWGSPSANMLDWAIHPRPLSLCREELLKHRKTTAVHTSLPSKCSKCSRPCMHIHIHRYRYPSNTVLPSNGACVRAQARPTIAPTTFPNISNAHVMWPRHGLCASPNPWDGVPQARID